MDNIPDSGSGGNTVGAEVVAAPPAGATPPSGAGEAPTGANTLVAPPGVNEPIPIGTIPPAPTNPEAIYGLKAPVGPAASTALPPIDKPAAAADQINDVKSGSTQAQVATGTTSGKPKKKNPKPAYDSKDESSSKHKPKKGLDKINPL
jgi:outer membrane protein assembly factor BamD